MGFEYTGHRNRKTPIFQEDSYPLTADGVIKPGGVNAKKDAYNLNTFESRDNPMFLYQRGDSPGAKAFRAKKFDLGNNFTKEDCSFSDFNYPMHDTGAPYKTSKWHYLGPYLPGSAWDMRNSMYVAANIPSYESINEDLYGLGGTGINRTIPTKSLTSLSTALGELRKDGLPRIVGLQTLKKGYSGKRIRPRDGADEYLNYQFGVAPLVSDVKKLLNSVRHSHDIIAEFLAQNDKFIRRSYHFRDQVETFDQVFKVGSFPVTAYLGWGNNMRVVGTSTTRSWFSGNFHYHLPVADSTIGKLKLWEAETNRLLGSRITPETLWNVTSWTWLIDWFTTIGDVISNISYLGQDGLVLRWGYIMRSVEVEARIISLNCIPRNGDQGPAACTGKFVQKARRKASPYGFGLNQNDLSPKQYSILGALGLTRAPGRLDVD